MLDQSDKAKLRKVFMYCDLFLAADRGYDFWVRGSRVTVHMPGTTSRAFFDFYDGEAARRFAGEAERWAWEYIAKKLARTGTKHRKPVAVRVTVQSS